MNTTLKTAVTATALMVVGVGVFKGSEAIYGKLFPWGPTTGTSPLVFATQPAKQGDQPVPLFQLTPEGLACQNIPALFKAWEAQVKAEAEAKAKTAKADTKTETTTPAKK